MNCKQRAKKQTRERSPQGMADWGRRAANFRWSRRRGPLEERRLDHVDNRARELRGRRLTPTEHAVYARVRRAARDCPAAALCVSEPELGMLTRKCVRSVRSASKALVELGLLARRRVPQKATPEVAAKLGLKPGSWLPGRYLYTLGPLAIAAPRRKRTETPVDPPRRAPRRSRRARQRAAQHATRRVKQAPAAAIAAPADAAYPQAKIAGQRVVLTERGRRGAYRPPPPAHPACSESSPPVTSSSIPPGRPARGSGPPEGGPHGREHIAPRSAAALLLAATEDKLRAGLELNEFDLLLLDRATAPPGKRR